jgi:phage tail sheath gpL-like
MTTLPSGLSASPTPSFSFAVRLGVGPEADSPADLDVMLLAQKTSAGSASAAVSVQVFDTTDAEAKFGARSRLAMLVRAFRAIAPRATLYACPVADPTGSPVSATARLDFSGPATAAGVVRLRIAGRLLSEVVIPSGTTAAAAADLVRVAIAAVAELPCTAAVGGASHEHELTLTAAHPGVSGNQLRVVFECTAAGITIALNELSTASSGKAYFGSGSPAVAGVGAVNLTAALAAIAGARYDRIVADVDDDTNRGRLTAHLVSQSSINTGHRCMGVVGSIEETLATVQADAVALNEPRCVIVYNRRSHNVCGELAAAYTAAKTYGDGRLPGETQYRAAKANGLSLYPAILATDEEERLTPTERDALLNAGVTPLGHDNLHPGYASVVRPVTTRTKNASGGTSYLVRDTSKVAVADMVADRCEAFASSAYADKNLVPDPVSIEDAPSSEFVTWPAAIRDDMLAILRKMESEFLLVNVSQYASQVTAEPLTVDGTQYVVCKVPFAVIPHLHSVVGDASQIG